MQTITLDDLPPGSFRNGYLGMSGDVSLPALDGWQRTTTGDVSFWLHPTLRMSTARRADTAVLIAGEVVDLDASTTDGTRIAEGIAAAAARGGIPAALRHVSDLGGRFACFVSTGGRFAAIPDCHGTQLIFWAQQPAGVAVSSHSHLLAEAVGADVDERTVALLRTAKAMGTGGTLYQPARLTPFVGVSPVLPNCHLIVEGPSAAPRHERFYPFPDTSLGDPADAYDTFRDLFRAHTRLLCDLGPVGISITAGVDSRTTLAAARPHLAPGSFTFTWHDFDKADPAEREDLDVGRAIAGHLGLPHTTVRLEPWEAGTAFATAFTRTFRHLPQFPRAAQAVATQLPEGFHQLQSMCAEVGTGFYRKRTQQTVDAQRLAHLYSPRPFGQLPEVVAAHEELIAYADFRQERLDPLDYHDLFYWETRLGRWAVLRMQEADLSHRMLLPFNHRRIIEALLSLPFEERQAKQPLHRFVAEHIGTELPADTGGGRDGRAAKGAAAPLPLTRDHRRRTGSRWRPRRILAAVRRRLRSG